MRILSFFLVGILFGITMTKSEAISWFRIHEMFRFESFHMYGIIGVAVILAAIFMYTLKRFNIKTMDGKEVSYFDFKMSYPRFLISGTIFGLGWALVGSCPGPMYVLFGHGYMIFAVVILSAIFGTLVYGMVRSKLPH